MEYIKSKDIFVLMRDSLRLIHPRLMDHGSRVAYMVYKMLEDKGGYEEFELADMVMVATLHDIGAYKTEAGALNDMLRYESKESKAHAIYGYLFFKYLSPVEDLAKVIMYHHTDYAQLQKIEYQYKDLAAYINIAEKMDLYYTAMGSQFNMQMFHKQAGTKLSAEGLERFYKVAKKFDIFTNIKTGEYKKELEYIIDFMIFSNEDKKKFLDMLMYCFGFRSETSVIDAITTIHICEQLANKLAMKEDAKEKLYYGALLHDLGMLKIPKEITEAPRKLNSEEIKKIRMHVLVAEQVMNTMLREDVLTLVLGHHERGDGTGYPKKMRAQQMSQELKVLQIADTVTGMTNKRNYREPLPKDKVISILNDEASKNRYDKQAVSVFISFYDDIMASVKKKSAEVIKTYQMLNTQYAQLNKRYKM